MVVRTAECRCGAVVARCEGEPVRVSVCHCLACQRRSGSAFAAQARFPSAQVTVSGETHAYVRTADSGRTITYRFCPTCGSTVAYDNEMWPGLTAVPLGSVLRVGAAEARLGGDRRRRRRAPRVVQRHRGSISRALRPQRKCFDSFRPWAW